MRLKTLILLFSFTLGFYIHSAAAEPREDLYTKLNDPDSGVVRAAVIDIGKSKDPEAPKKLVEFYRTGETHDWWQYHIKNEILIALSNLAISDLVFAEELPLALEVLPHENLTLFRSAVRLISNLGQKHKGESGKHKVEAGEKLLAFAERDRNTEKIPDLIRGLGDLRYEPAVDYVSRVYKEQKMPKGYSLDWVVAYALYNIDSPRGLDTIMTIYVKTPPLKGMTCLDGEPIIFCLMALKKISGRDFGDDRDEWKRWYQEYRKG